MDRLLTALELEKSLGVKRATIYQWAREGLLPHIRIGNKVRFPQAAMDGWMERQTRLEKEIG